MYEAATEAALYIY